jgi:uncharacterized protein
MKKLPLLCILYFVFCPWAEVFGEFVVPPLPASPVYDEVGILSSEEKTALEQQILTLETETSHQIGIAIIKSLQGRTIEEVWIVLARSWWIGQKGLDNGLLILIAPTEREMRIEVGRGLEWVITDLMSARIIDENFTPNFKNEAYGAGLTEGIERMAPLLRGEVLELPEKTGLSDDAIEGIIIFIVVFGWLILSILSASKSWWLGGVFWGVIGFFVIGITGVFLIGILGLILDFFLSKFAYGKISLLKSMGNNRWWGGGGFGGGHSGGWWGGFWGGGFGWGGASGKW